MGDIVKGVIYIVGSLFANAFVPLLSQWSMKSFKPLEVALLISFLNVIYCLMWHFKWPIFHNYLFLKQYLRSAIINAIGIICLYLSLGYLDPISFAFISVFYVVFTVLISTFVLKEGKTFLEIGAIAVGIFGAFLIASKGTADWSSVIGVALVLMDTLCFAVANFLVKSASPPLDPVGVLFFNNATCSIILIVILVPGFARYSSLNIQPAHVLGILAASACSFAAVGLVFASYRFLSFRLSSLMRAIKPIISTGVALPFAPSELSGGNWFGALLLFVSILVLVSRERKV